MRELMRAMRWMRNPRGAAKGHLIRVIMQLLRRGLR